VPSFDRISEPDQYSLLDEFLYTLRKHLLMTLCNEAAPGVYFCPNWRPSSFGSASEVVKIGSPSCSKRRVPEPDTQLLVSGA